jgi:spermidine/putrescine transport system ATP-binding protein
VECRKQTQSPTNHPALAVEASGLSRSFGSVRALVDLSLTVRRGEFFSLLGPSGCGKTTLLRLIGGLDLPDSGTLRIDGKDAVSIPAHLRPVNTVFQSYALFPHMSIWQNVAFGLKMKGVPRDELRNRVGRVMELVQINDLGNRRPAQLSGGQKQRVALARALVNEPQVLLLDEPLGALDLKLRKQLQVELHQLQRRLGITFIHVTHDQDEALVMSDRIAVMNSGRIEQLGTAEEIYERPRTRFVAQFIGACNLFAGNVVRATTSDGVQIHSPFGVLFVSPDRLTRDASPPPPGACVTLGIRPEKIHLSRTDSLPFENCVAARVENLVYSGAETQYQLQSHGAALNAVALNSAHRHQGFSVGDTVLCYLPQSALVVLDD